MCAFMLTYHPPDKHDYLQMFFTKTIQVFAWVSESVDTKKQVLTPVHLIYEH